MPRGNGSYLGQTANPNSNVASGIWTVREAETYLRADKWPAQPTVPSAPTGEPGNGQVALTWTAPTGGLPPTDYIVQYSSNGGSSWTTFSDGVSTATSATVTGLTNGTGYIFRIIAVNALGQSPAGSASGTVTPAESPWIAFLGSGVGANTIAAYDWRDSDGTTLAGRVGPTLDVFGVSIEADGGVFSDEENDYAEAQQAVAVSYPFTIAVVASALTGVQGVLMTFGQLPPMTTLFGRSGSGLLPYNGVDGQYFSYLPNGEWYFAAVSFSQDGTTRYFVKTSSQALHGTVGSQAGVENFSGAPAFGKFFNSLEAPEGKILIGMGINQGFGSQAAMEELYTEMRPLFAAATSLPAL